MAAMQSVAEWLRSARERQSMPDGEPWTQEHFLEQLDRATGWRLHRSNYSAYENGRQIPKRATLQRFVDFWRPYGVAAPSLEPEAAPPEPMAAIVAAIQANTAMLAELVGAVTHLSKTTHGDVLGLADALGRMPQLLADGLAQSLRGLPGDTEPPDRAGNPPRTGHRAP